MKAPSVYIVIKTRGDGYGHNSYEYVSWHFDKREAQDIADENKGEFEWWSVEEVPAADPAPKPDRW